MKMKLFMLFLALFAVGMAVPSTRVEIVARTVTPLRNAIGARLAPGRLEAMANQLDVRLSRAERMPSENFPAWIRRDYTGPETDPWGASWYLQVGRRSYTVGSMGPDGEQGTADDITESRDFPSGR